MAEICAKFRCVKEILSATERCVLNIPLRTSSITILSPNLALFSVLSTGPINMRFM